MEKCTFRAHTQSKSALTSEQGVSFQVETLIERERKTFQFHETQKRRKISDFKIKVEKFSFFSASLRKSLFCQGRRMNTQ